MRVSKSFVNIIVKHLLHSKRVKVYKKDANFHKEINVFAGHYQYISIFFVSRFYKVSVNFLLNFAEITDFISCVDS